MGTTHIIFDSIIFGGILCTAIGGVLFLYLSQRTRSSHRIIKAASRTVATLLFLSAAVLIYGSFIEPQIIVVKHEQIDLLEIENPVRIVFVADYQVGPYKQTDFVARSVEKIIELEPDIVLFGGDQIDNNGVPVDETVNLTPIRALAERFPTYAIHGNHEYGIYGAESIQNPTLRYPDRSAETKQAMEQLGVRYLVNEVIEIDLNESSFYLFGGDSWWAGRLDVSVLEKRSKTIPTIALVHNPAATWYMDENTDVDLMLSGHTHGGQIRLPFLGPLGRVDNVIPAAWYKGWYTHNDLRVFVTSGIGESGTRARLFNLPEIVLLEVY